MHFKYFKAIIFLYLLLQSCTNHGVLDQFKNLKSLKTGPFLVFTSLKTTLGNMTDFSQAECLGLSGIAKANCGCQQEAKEAGLTNNGERFRAWLATSSPQSAICTVFGKTGTKPGCITNTSESIGPWKRVDGAIVFNSLSELLSPSPLPVNSISLTANNNAVPGVQSVWTGTTASGDDSGFTCADWTDAVCPNIGTIGDINVTTIAYTSNGQAGSSTPQHVYCFEAPE